MTAALVFDPIGQMIASFNALWPDLHLRVNLEYQVPERFGEAWGISYTETGEMTVSIDYRAPVFLVLEHLCMGLSVAVVAAAHQRNGNVVGPDVFEATFKSLEAEFNRRSLAAMSPDMGHLVLENGDIVRGPTPPGEKPH